MALRASYYGVKRNLKDERAKLDGAKIIKSVGAGLNFNATTGALSCKSGTLSQAGIVQLIDDVLEDNTNPVTGNAVFKALQPEDGEITSTFTLESASYLKKQQNIVTAYIAINSCTASTSDVIATLPTGFKPAAALTLIGLNSSDSTILPVFVFGNGEIKLASGVTTKNIRLPLTFSV